MKREYKVGESYEFETIEIRHDRFSDYIALRDDERDTYRVYNILKFQYDELPEKITAIVKDVDCMGRPKLKQEVASIYEKIYDFGKEYTFKVTDIKQDICSLNKAEYYELEDEYCIHRSYFKEQKYKIGDECQMIVEKVSDNGEYLIIKEPKQENAEVANKVNSPIEANDSFVEDKRSYPVLDLGEESTTLEYKTSIVFKNGAANIDDQLFIIVRSMVAFMNAEGGDLYIGIHDKTRRVVGIEHDYPHLNEGTDEYNGMYDNTIDKYQLKIRHALEKLSQGVAEQLVEFDFPTEQGVQYCHIKVQKAQRPIWVNGHLLYQRTGNRITELRNDDINDFVSKKMLPTLLQINGDGWNKITPEKIAEAVKIINNAHRQAVAAPKLVADPNEVDYYIVWYKDGTWKRVRNMDSSEQNVFCSIPVEKTDKDGILVFCHKSGTVNEVKLKVFRTGVNLNVPRNYGFNPNETPISIFLVNTNNFIAVYSSDEHGSEFVKLHRVTDINPTQAAKNQGSRIIPTNGIVSKYKVVSGEFESKIPGLIFPAAKTSQEFGVPIASPALSDEITFLDGLY